jgi:hypothetical protein
MKPQIITALPNFFLDFHSWDTLHPKDFIFDITSISQGIRNPTLSMTENNNFDNVSWCADSA